MATIYKTSKYLRFDMIKDTGKTKTIFIINIHHDECLGEIKWFSRWRQYCFFPNVCTIWNKDCLNEINEVIKQLMDERKPVKKSIKVVGVVARSMEDFLNWKKDKRHKPERTDKNTIRQYVYRGKRYVGLSVPTHCCGYSFDEVIETQTAHMNSEYDRIVSIIKPTLKPGGKWMGTKL